MNKTPSEASAVVGIIDPDAYAAAAYTTDYFALKDFQRFQAIVQVGDIVSTGTVDAKLTVYTSGAGANPLDVPGAAITQLTQAGTDSNKQAIINLNTDTVAGNTKYTHGRLTVTLGTAGADMSAIVLGFGPKYAPASDSDLATVDEIVSV